MSTRQFNAHKRWENTDAVPPWQAQGRMEEQRSKAPGPMDDEDFFSLLLKVQGGRMEEQRTELPVALRY